MIQVGDTVRCKGDPNLWVVHSISSGCAFLRRFCDVKKKWIEVPAVGPGLIVVKEAITK